MNDRELHCRSMEVEERVKARRAITPEQRDAHRDAADEWVVEGDKASAQPATDA